VQFYPYCGSILCCIEVILWLGKNFWPLKPITITWGREINVSTSVLTPLSPCENVTSPTVLGDLTLHNANHSTLYGHIIPWTLLTLIQHFILNAFHGSTITEPLRPAKWLEFKPLHHWRVKVLPFSQTVRSTTHKLTKLWCWGPYFSGMLYTV
jgi:hypothetical protein